MKKTPKIPRSDPDYKTPLPNFKGQRQSPYDIRGPVPPSRKTTETRFRPDAL